MTDNTQPEALRLAQMLEALGWRSVDKDLRVAATELRRLHAENTAIQAGYAAARLEIESLRARSAEPAGEYPALPEGWPARFRCDSCDGNGEVGDPMYQGHFQPPERARCADCDGKGWCSEEKAFSVDDMRAYVDADRSMRAAQPATDDDRAAFKAYLEDCDECAIVPDIAGAFHAGWASRVHAAQPAGAQQPGADYAALFDALSQHDDPCDDFAEAVQRVRALRAEVERLTRADSARVDALALRASRGQAPAQAAPAAVAGPSGPSITLDFKMASELLDMFGGEPGLVTLQHGGEKCHSGVGLYAWYSDLPEEGAGFLGAEPDDEAAPTTQPAPQQEAQEPVGSVRYTERRAVVDWYGLTPQSGAKLYTAPQPAPVSQGDALDAARYRMVRRGQHWSVIDGIGNDLRADALDAAIDVARAAQKGGA